MRDNIYHVSLDMHDEASQVQIAVKQGATGNSIHFTLTEDGKPFTDFYGETAETVCTVNAILVYPNREVNQRTCDIRRDGHIIYEIPTINEAGICEVELSITDSEDKIICTPRFTIYSTENVYTGEHQPNTTQFEAINTATQKANEAKTAAEEATRNAVAATADATRAANNADDKALEAGAAAGRADEAVLIVNEAVEKAETAADRADRATESANGAAAVAAYQAGEAGTAADEARAATAESEAATAGAVSATNAATVAGEFANGAGMEAILAARAAEKVNISAVRGEGIVNIITTNKDGTPTVVQVFDGKKGEKGDPGEAGDVYSKAETDAKLSVKADVDAVPTMLAELSGDSNHRVVTDAQIAKWNEGGGGITLPIQIEDVDGLEYSLGAMEIAISGKANKSEIPTVPSKVSAFTNDAGYLTEHQDISGKADKSEIPTVPTAVSAFTNDAGYLTEHQDISGKADKNEIPTKLSDLEGDSTHRTVTDAQISKWNQGGGGGGDITLPILITDVAGLETALEVLDDGIKSKADVSAIPTQLSQLAEDESHKTVSQDKIDVWDAAADLAYKYDVELIPNETLSAIAMLKHDGLTIHYADIIEASENGKEPFFFMSFGADAINFGIQSVGDNCFVVSTTVQSPINNHWTVFAVRIFADETSQVYMLDLEKEGGGGGEGGSETLRIPVVEVDIGQYAFAEGVELDFSTIKAYITNGGNVEISRVNGADFELFGIKSVSYERIEFQNVTRHSEPAYTSIEVFGINADNSLDYEDKIIKENLIVVAKLENDSTYSLSYDSLEGEAVEFDTVVGLMYAGVSVRFQIEGVVNPGECWRTDVDKFTDEYIHAGNVGKYGIPGHLYYFDFQLKNDGTYVADLNELIS